MYPCGAGRDSARCADTPTFPDGDDPVATMTKPARTKHRSAEITHDPQRAPARAMLMAMGITHEDMEKPFVAIANLASDVTPCNVHLSRFANGPRKASAPPMACPSSSAPSQSATAYPWAPRA